MKYLHPYLFEIIHDIIEQRISEHKFPYIATLNEIQLTVQENVKEALDEMEKDGLLTHCSNINGVGLYRALKEKCKDENNNVQ